MALLITVSRLACGLLRLMSEVQLTPALSLRAAGALLGRGWGYCVRRAAPGRATPDVPRDAGCGGPAIASVRGSLAWLLYVWPPIVLELRMV
jgi:hypothetical protein